MGPKRPPERSPFLSAAFFEAYARSNSLRATGLLAWTAPITCGTGSASFTTLMSQQPDAGSRDGGVAFGVMPGQPDNG